MQITSASVKVMRSFDYCHFEVVLGISNTDEMGNPLGSLTSEHIDAARKQAARLADKAVAQYKIAKANAASRESEAYSRSIEVQRMERIRATTETDRTVGQQAELKAFDDAAYHARREYDYEDNREE